MASPSTTATVTTTRTAAAGTDATTSPTGHAHSQREPAVASERDRGHIATARATPPASPPEVLFPRAAPLADALAPATVPTAIVPRRMHARSAAAVTTRVVPAPAPPPVPRVCLRPPVEFQQMRGGASWSGPLVDCDGHPTVRAMAALAILASPRELEQLPDLAPVMQEIRRIAPAVGWTLVEETRTAVARTTTAACPPGQEQVASPPASSAAHASRVESTAASAGAHARPLHASRRPATTCRPIPVERDPHTHDPQIVLENSVRLLNPRLVAMLSVVAQEFPRHRFEVISGYRPSQNPHESSRHAHARAMDFRLSGVSREALRDFARTFPNSGVGYYPNSVFVHLDVRDPDEGNARWTDYSMHGERPRYGHWPPRETDVARESDYLVGQARRALDGLREAAEHEHAPEGSAPAARDDNPDDGAEEHTSPAHPEESPANEAPSTPSPAPIHDSDRTAQNH